MCALAVTLVVLMSRGLPAATVAQRAHDGARKRSLSPGDACACPWSPRVYLLRGLIWSLAGVALAICLFGISSTSQRRESYESKAYEAGQLAHNLDIPLDQAKQIVDKDPARPKARRRPSPCWASFPWPSDWLTWRSTTATHRGSCPSRERKRAVAAGHCRAGSITADIDPWDRGRRQSGPYEWIWSRAYSASRSSQVISAVRV